MRHKLMSVCLAMWLLLAMPVTVFAEDFDAEQTGSIEITLLEKEEKMPISGAEFSLYHVASAQLNSENEVDYTYTAEFEAGGAAQDEMMIPAKMDEFVEEEHSQPAATSVTDEEGSAVFDSLPVGLYFVKQTQSAEDYAPCSPFLVEVPNRSAQGYVYNIKASPKTQPQRTVNVTVEKVWNTDDPSRIPDSVTVQLLRDDVVVKTAVLNEGNNWKITYSNMPESDSYDVYEPNVPEGFTETYLLGEYEFVVINSAIPLAQTGQLVWPIPVLALAGLVLIGLGAVMLLKSRDENA